MKNELLEHDFDPSLHIVPLDTKGRVPAIFIDENMLTLIAVTTDGRITFLPSMWENVLIGGKYEGYLNTLELAIKNRIAERFPKGKDPNGQKIRQYLLACVVYNNPDEKWHKFIFEVVGLLDRSKNLESLHKTLHSLLETKVGDEHYRMVENNLSSEPGKSWLNNLINSLKEQGWADYVREHLDDELDD